MRGVVGAAVLLLLTVPACSGPQHSAPDPGWHRVTLPAGIRPGLLASGPDGSLLVASDGEASGTRAPKVVRLRGDEVGEVAVRPTTYYGRRTAWRAVAVHGETLYAVGGRPGGAHGNTRWTTWSGDSRLDEDAQAFETFGGTKGGALTGVVVTRSGTPLLVGSRVSDAGPGMDVAVWDLRGHTWVRRSSRGTALAADADQQPVAHTVTTRGGGVLVAGSVTELGGGLPRTRGAVWVAPDADGPWRRMVLPDPSGADEPVVEARAAVCDVDGGCLVAGDAGGRLVGWWVDAQGRATPADLPALGAVQPYVAATGGVVTVAVTTPTGSTQVLVSHGDGWSQVDGPAGDVAGLELADGRAWLLTRSGDGGRLWSGPGSGISARP